MTGLGKDLSEFAKAHGINGIKNKKLRELVLLDDWGTIAKWAIPMIEKGGEKAIEWLWDKYAPSIREMVGFD